MMFLEKNARKKVQTQIRERERETRGRGNQKCKTNPNYSVAPDKNESSIKKSFH